MEEYEKVIPVSPSDIMDNLADIIPQIVIEAVNSILIAKYRGSGITIKQDDIIDKIISLDTSLTKKDIIEKKMLDFEQIYSDNGWVVKYDRPGFNESYAAYFEFSKKNK